MGKSRGRPWDTIRSRIRISESGCWLWLGRLDPCGYARFTIRGRPFLVHRLLFSIFVGPIPDGYCLDHLCRVRNCVNPNHLEPVTRGENTRRGWPAQKTHCVNGHPYDEANTYIRPSGQRDCRACFRERSRRYKERKRVAA